MGETMRDGCMPTHNPELGGSNPSYYYRKNIRTI